MRRMRIVTLSLLLAVLTILALAQANPAGLFFPQQSQEPPVENTEPTLSTDKGSYVVGETVVFSGEGYTPGGSYQLIITKDGETYETIGFEATGEGKIPEEVEWNIEEGVPSGLYTAILYNAPDPEDPETWGEVASVEFTVNAATLHTDKDEYMVEETVVFTGAGYTPGGTSYVIRIVFGEQVLAELSFSSSEDGSIPVGVDEVNWTIPFDAPDGTYVAKAYNDTEPEKGVLLALTEFRVNASMAARAEAIFRELEALNSTINADVVGINVSLTQKVNVVTKKIEQFMKWVEEDKNNTAANMLNAAVNNLRALIHHVEAQKGKHIDDETADQLIAQAQELIEKMETTISSMGAKGKGKQVSTQARTQEQEMEREGRGQGNSDGKGKAKGKNK